MQRAGETGAGWTHGRAVGPAHAPERFEWLELFFDLVVAVAAVAVLSDALRDDPTRAGLGLFLVTYGALWLAWVAS